MARKNKPLKVYNFRDKDACIQAYRDQLLNKTLNLFQYEGLPDTIPVRELEKIIQMTGTATITEVNGELYAFFGGLGEKMDVYYRPTHSIVNNPWINFNKSLEIGKECCIIHNNSTWTPIFQFADRLITQMVENDVTHNIALIMTRLTSFINVHDDMDKIAADKMIQDIIDGNLSSLCTDDLFSSVQTQPYGGTGANALTQIIEDAQYLKGTLQNEFGISDNLNLKREYVNETEMDLYNQPMKPLIYDMLNQRELGLAEVNKMYGLNVSVKINPVYLPEAPEDTDSTETPDDDEKEVADEE